MANLASIDPILKEVYEGTIREQLDSQIITLKRIERSSNGVYSDAIGGRYVTFPIHVSRNSGIGARNELEPLPEPGAQGYAAARVGLRSQYGSISVTGQSIAQSKTNPQAFAKVLEQEITGIKDDVKVDMNRQVYGTGSGGISTVRTAATSNTIAVQDARAFQSEMIVDLITLPSTVSVSKRRVTAIDLTPGANTITVDGAAVAATVGMVITRTGSFGREITGFGSIVNDSGVLYNVNPATYPVWKSTVYSNGGTNRAVTEGLMTQMVDEITAKGGKTTVIFTSQGVRRSYANLLMQTRSTVNMQEFTGGFKGLAFVTDGELGEIPLIADHTAPSNTMHFINEDDLTFYRDEAWHWVDNGDGMWQRKTDAAGTYDAWYANLVEYHELGAHRRNTHGKITDLVES